MLSRSGGGKACSVGGEIVRTNANASTDAHEFEATPCVFTFEGPFADGQKAGNFGQGHNASEWREGVVL